MRRAARPIEGRDKSSIGGFDGAGSERDRGRRGRRHHLPPARDRRPCGRQLPRRGRRAGNRGRRPQQAGHRRHPRLRAQRGREDRLPRCGEPGHERQGQAADPGDHQRRDRGRRGEQGGDLGTALGRGQLRAGRRRRWRGPWPGLGTSRPARNLHAGAASLQLGVRRHLRPVGRAGLLRPARPAPHVRVRDEARAPGGREGGFQQARRALPEDPAAAGGDDRRRPELALRRRAVPHPRLLLPDGGRLRRLHPHDRRAGAGPEASAGVDARGRPVPRGLPRRSALHGLGGRPRPDPDERQGGRRPAPSARRAWSAATSTSRSSTTASR